MLKLGSSSQSGGRSFGLLDDFCEGVGEGPGEFGEKQEFDEDAGFSDELEELVRELSVLEEAPELVEARRRAAYVVGVCIRYCHPTLTSKRLGSSCLPDT